MCHEKVAQQKYVPRKSGTKKNVPRKNVVHFSLSTNLSIAVFRYVLASLLSVGRSVSPSVGQWYKKVVPRKRGTRKLCHENVAQEKMCHVVHVCLSALRSIALSIHLSVCIMHTLTTCVLPGNQPVDQPTDRPTDQRTDRPTNGPTDRPTDTPSYRDAKTHLNKCMTQP